MKKVLRKSWLTEAIHANAFNIFFMDMTKEKIQKIRKEYKANEDKNYHSENIVLLAKNFGTKEVWNLIMGLEFMH